MTSPTLTPQEFNKHITESMCVFEVMCIESSQHIQNLSKKMQFQMSEEDSMYTQLYTCIVSVHLIVESLWSKGGICCPVPAPVPHPLHMFMLPR